MYNRNMQNSMTSGLRDASNLLAALLHVLRLPRPLRVGIRDLEQSGAKN